MIVNKYSWSIPENAKYFWHWYSVLCDKLTGRIRVLNCPDSIDADFLIRRLLLDGRIAFFMDNGELTAYDCSNASPLDKYGRTQDILVTYRHGVHQNKNRYTPAEYIMVYSKPSVKLNRGVGYVSEVVRTADILANIDNTFKIRLENDRLTAIADVVADNDITAVNELFSRMRRGDNVIACKSSIIDNIKVNPLVGSGSLTQITDYNKLTQYYIAEFYNNIGINALMGEKKERMVSDEITANSEVVEYSFKQTIDLIKKGLEEVNAKFGSTITIEFIDCDADEIEGCENDDDITSKANEEETSIDETVDENESREETDTDNENETDMSTDDKSVNIDADEIVINTENITIEGGDDDE